MNEIYMTWRYSQNQATKDTAESLLKKLRPLSDNGQLGAIEYTILEQPRPPEPGREKPEWENPVQANPVLDSPVLGKPEQENPAQLSQQKSYPNFML